MITMMLMKTTVKDNDDKDYEYNKIAYMTVLTFSQIYFIPFRVFTILFRAIKGPVVVKFLTINNKTNICVFVMVFRVLSIAKRRAYTQQRSG